MIYENEIEAIRGHTERMEDWVNNEVSKIVQDQSMGVVASILMNLGTSMLAKSVILAKDSEHKERIMEIIIKVLKVKIMEGEAAVESLVAVEKAMSTNFMPPSNTKH